MREAWVEIYMHPTTPTGSTGSSLPRLYFEAPPQFRHEDMEILVRGISNSFRNAGLDVELKSVLDGRRVLDITQIAPAAAIAAPADDPIKALHEQLCGIRAELVFAREERQREAKRKRLVLRRPEKKKIGRNH